MRRGKQAQPFEIRHHGPNRGRRQIQPARQSFRPHGLSIAQITFDDEPEDLSRTVRQFEERWAGHAHDLGSDGPALNRFRAG